MKVKLATQIFSRDVYAALAFAEKCDKMQCEGTRELVLFMDQLFDSLNSVRNASKPLKRILTDKSQHIHFWGTAKPFLSKLKFFKNNQPVSPPPSVKNFIITIRNIQDLWKHMKDIGFKFLSTRCLQQDPLENFFGIIRGLCGQNFRPTCIQFTASYKTCLINNLVSNSRLTN